MKRILVLIILILFSFNSFSQTKKDSIYVKPIGKNTLFVELLGNALYYSLNYERIVFNQNKIRLASRIGASYFPSAWASVPLELSLIFGSKHCFETGIGATYIKFYPHDTSNPNYITSTLYLNIRLLGYRFQKSTGGFFMKAGLCPLIKLVDFNENVNNDDYLPRLIPMVGLGIGYTFKKSIR